MKHIKSFENITSPVDFYQQQLYSISFSLIEEQNNLFDTTKDMFDILIERNREFKLFYYDGSEGIAVLFLTPDPLDDADITQFSEFFIKVDMNDMPSMEAELKSLEVTLDELELKLDTDKYNI